MTTVVIEPGRSNRNYWRDVWAYRELFYFLSWRDLLVRYKQTAIGVLWAIGRPFLAMLIFTFVFSRIARLPTAGAAPYSVMVFAALLPWQFVATAMSEASNSLVGNVNLVSKVYFPRIIIPASAVITSFADFVITCALLAAIMAWYGFWPDWRIVALPLFTLLAFGAAFGCGLLLCALNVAYRDVRYVVPFIVQFGLYVSPVGFNSALVPPRWRALYALNPMVGIIDGFRWSLLRGEPALWWPGLLSAGVTTALACAVGIWYFRKTERTFADVI
jgi:lipopolysaccharide transport system permease protein